MATTQQTIRQTGFTVGTTSARFGLLWPDGGLLMTDWSRASKFVDLEGPSITVTQLFGHGPRRVTYRLFFETVADFKALDDLSQQTGTLTVVDGGHTVPVDNADQHFIHDRVYDALPSATLLSLVSLGVAGDGSCEADAVFQVSS